MSVIFGWIILLLFTVIGIWAASLIPKSNIDRPIWASYPNLKLSLFVAAIGVAVGVLLTNRYQVIKIIISILLIFSGYWWSRKKEIAVWTMHSARAGEKTPSPKEAKDLAKTLYKTRSRY